MSLQKQGANKGAVTAFMISTPESGVDSIAITYALLDPVMTVARPVVAFVTAAAAGITENLMGGGASRKGSPADLTCPVDGCCDGTDCPPERHKNHHTFGEKLKSGLSYAFGELWTDMAGWFFIGVILAGLITAFIPDDVFSRYLGSGLPAMLLMLAVGIPLYICATASTPIAAALILKGVSPGAALVFLLVGPATNITSLTVLLGILGKRATAVYLVAIAVCAVVFGLLVDGLYGAMGISARASVAQATELVPEWMALSGTLVLLLLALMPLIRRLRANPKAAAPAPENPPAPEAGSDMPAALPACGPT